MKRTQKQRKIRDTILIVTNGKRTEKLYFGNLTNSFSSMFKIKVEYKNEQPDELVEYAKSLDSNLYNQIWCVFDIDDSYKEGYLLYALAEAKKHNINIAYSNEAFEVWLLCHLTKNIRPSLIRKTYIKEINNYLEEKRLPKYQKNDLDLLKNQFIPKALQASEVAKKIYQSFEANHQKEFSGNKNYPIWDWKSTTTVYQLIEALQLNPKYE